MPIKILLVDDHAVVRSGLSKFLMVNKDLKLVGEASDGAEALQMVSLHKPDVVLMDLMMPGVDGITATREIHKKYPKVKVIALTSFAEQNMVQGSLQAGAIGYLQNNVTAKELGHAIRSAYEGRMTLSPEATQVLANSVAQPQIAGEQLTERERDVLKCMAEGLNNNEIAEKLVVSLGTVKFHISNIFHKLGVDSRVEAVKLALEQKLAQQAHEKGAVVIDWMTASSGNPWGDVARTSLLLSIGAKNAGKAVSPMIRVFIRFYHQVYLKHYMNLVHDGGNEYRKWMPIVSAARLAEKIDGEQEALIEMIRAGLME